MTFEKKCLVEPSDVIAVHFECNDCHASVVVPLTVTAGVSSHALNTAGMSCQFCHKPWGIIPNSEEHKVISEFTESLEKLAANMKGRRLKLHLEIKCQE